MSTNEDKKGIVLNRMYTGSYLSTNLGHEVINMFQADNGKHYLYLNAKGNFAKEHGKQISDMLLVRYAGDNKVEVLAWANGLEEVEGAGDTYKNFEQNGDIFKKQQDYIKKNKITYGQRDLVEIFCGSVQQNVYITYCAECFFRPTKKIYIKYVEENDLLYNDNYLSNKEDSKKELTIFLSGYQFGKATLKQYIYPTNHKNSKYKFDKRKKNEEFKNNLKNSGKKEEDFIQGLEERVKGKRGEDWDILSQLLNCDYKVNDNKDDLWRKVADDEDKITDEIINSYQPRKVSLFDIMPKLQRDENCFSDALKYFMQRDKVEWQAILQKICYPQNEKEIGRICDIKREEDATIKTKRNNEEEQNSDQKKGGRIDLFIKTEYAYIVIENKIKSDINRKRDDKIDEDQLDRYRKYVESLEEKVPCFYFVLAPDYNMPDNIENKGYSKLTYSFLIESLKEYHDKHKKEKLWSAFYDAMKRHSYDSENQSLYEDMKSTFFARIKEIRSNQGGNV